MTSGIQIFDLSGKRVLITGSSQGIGLTLAQGLGKAGAEILLNGRDTEKLANASETCLLYTSPSPRDATLSRMPSSA